MATAFETAMAAPMKTTSRDTGANQILADYFQCILEAVTLFQPDSLFRPL